jgi:hypothetical protein
MKLYLHEFGFWIQDREGQIFYFAAFRIRTGLVTDPEPNPIADPETNPSVDLDQTQAFHEGNNNFDIVSHCSVLALN